MIQLGQLKNFLFSRYFLSIFFGDIFLTKFLLKLPIDPSCSIYEFYKDRLQSLRENKFPQWLKKILAHFNHYDLINEEESTVQF